MGLFALIPACGQTELEPPELTAVEPDTITTRGGEVRVLGRHLWVEPRVDLGSSDPPSLDRNWAVLIDEQRLPTDAVVWIDTVTLEATIPSGLLPGLKDVVAISPSGLKAVLPDGLTVLDETEATLRIEDAPGGTGQAVGDVTLSVGGQLVLYAVGRNGTELTDVDAQWTIDGSAGTISPELGPDTVFEAVAAGTAVVTAHHLLYGTDSTGTITVESCSTGGWYLDADGDGHGDPAAPYSGAECPPPSGYVEDDADCDDDPDGCGADCHPGAPELCDGLDNDCDPATDDGADVAAGDPCDGPDLDKCLDDAVIACVGGVLECTVGPDDIEGPAGDPLCSDQVDNDCDGLTDEEDPSCGVGFCSDDWCWLNPLPCGNSLHGVWVSEQGNVWAIEAAGILSYEQATGRWSRTPIDQMSWEDIFGFSETDIWAVGGGGRVLHYDGAEWTEVSNAATQWLQGVWGASSDDLYAVGFGGQIVHHDGALWTPEPSFTLERLHGVWGAGSTDVWTVGENSTILHRTGGAWRSVPNPAPGSLYGVWGTGAADVWAVGAVGTVLHYDGSWSTVSAGATGMLSSVWGSAADDVWVVGTNGEALHKSSAGWMSVDTGTEAWLQSVRSNTSGDTWAVGEGCALVQCDGTSESCAFHSGGSRNSLHALWGASEDDVWAAGLGGGILHYEGAGGFQEVASGTNQWLQDLWGASSSDVWAVGTGGTTLHWDGADWEQVSNPAGQGLVSVFGTGPDDVWVVGDAGVTLHWDDSGSFTEVSTPVGFNLRGVWAAAPDGVWAVGEFGTLLHYDGTWQVDTSIFVPTDLQDVWGCGADDVWAVGDAGVILHYGGNGWSSVPSPVTVDLHGIWGNGCSDVWIAGTSSRILHWDGTGPWVRVESPSNAVFYDTWVDPAGGVWAAGMDGTIIYRQPGVGN